MRQIRLCGETDDIASVTSINYTSEQSKGAT